VTRLGFFQTLTALTAYVVTPRSHGFRPPVAAKTVNAGTPARSPPADDTPPAQTQIENRCILVVELAKSRLAG
jgi:hypothetical protein